MDKWYVYKVERDLERRGEREREKKREREGVINGWDKSGTAMA